MSFPISPTLFQQQYEEQAPYTEAAENDRWSQTQWMRTLYPASRSIQEMFAMPQMAGQQIPYQNFMKSQLYPEGMSTTFGPENLSPGTQYLQNFFQNKSYGLPEDIAQAMSAQAMAPIRLGDIGSQTPAKLSGSIQPDTSRMVAAALGTQRPDNIDVLSKLAGAAKLGQYNAWRGGLLPDIIG